MKKEDRYIILLERRKGCGRPLMIYDGVRAANCNCDNDERRRRSGAVGSSIIFFIT